MLLSVSGQLAVATILLGGGLLANFAGYRLLRGFLLVYGFVGGAIITHSFVSHLETWLEVAATIAGALSGSVLSIVIYLAGVAIVGAAVAALSLHLAVTGVPNDWFLISTCIFGALVALAVRNYFLMVSTAFVGGWTALVGGLVLLRQDTALPVISGDFSLIFPLAPFESQPIFAVGWLILGLCGSFVQLWSTGRASAGKETSEDRQKLQK